MSARNEDFWNQFDDGGDLEAAARYVERNPDATVAEVLGRFDLDLDHRDDVEQMIAEATDEDVAEALEDLEDDEPETRVGNYRVDDCDVYGGRSSFKDGRVKHFANTPIGERGWLGSPYVLEEHADDEHYRQPDVTVVETREEAVGRFCHDFLEAVDERPELRRALYEDVRGRVLGGWCQRLEDDGPLCHLEVVARVADAIEKRGGSA